MYRWLLLAHILAAVIWVGGAATTQVLAMRVRRAGDPARMAAMAGDIEWIGGRIFMPASVVVLVAGILLVLQGGWAFEDAWVAFALIVVLASAVVGAGFLGPESGRIKRLMTDRGVDDAEVRHRIGRIFLVSRIELVLLLLVVADMVLKPGG